MTGMLGPLLVSWLARIALHADILRDLLSHSASGTLRMLRSDPSSGLVLISTSPVLASYSSLLVCLEV